MHGHARHLATVTNLCGLVFTEVELHQLFGGHGGESVGFTGVVAELDLEDAVRPLLDNCTYLTAAQALVRQGFRQRHNVKYFDRLHLCAYLLHGMKQLVRRGKSSSFLMRHVERTITCPRMPVTLKS